MQKNNVGKKELDSLARKISIFSSVTSNKYSTKENQVEMTNLTGGISVSARRSFRWNSSGVELMLFWQFCNPGKYGILTHSLNSSRPNAEVYSNLK